MYDLGSASLDFLKFGLLIISHSSQVNPENQSFVGSNCNSLVKFRYGRAAYLISLADISYS